MLPGMNRASLDLSGRVVAITGGARGIGLATARELVRRGVRVAIGDLDSELLAESAEELGGNGIGVVLDVTDRESFRSFLDAVEQELGPLHGLVNNAGIMPLSRFEEEDDETTDRILGINVTGVATGTKLALKRMLPRGGGHIVNIASQAGRAGMAGGATYSASKHAVVGLSASVADELEGTGVELTCIMPSVVQTELAAGVGSPRLIGELQPEDVANAIADAFERPRRSVHVPPLAVITAPVGALPVGIRHPIERAFGARNLLLSSDREARGEYEKRAGGRE